MALSRFEKRKEAETQTETGQLQELILDLICLERENWDSNRDTGRDTIGESKPEQRPGRK